jgi:hypothetical protein
MAVVPNESSFAGPMGRALYQDAEDSSLRSE